MLEEDKINISPQTLFNIILISESIILLISTIFIDLNKINLTPYLHFNRYCLISGLIAGLTISFIAKLIYIIGKTGKFEIFRGFVDIYTDSVYKKFKQFNITQILLISLISGFCEEVFFRGVLQTLVGVYPCNLIFAFIHAPRLSFWVLFILSFLAGLVFSYLKIYFHSLWPAIIGHSVNNFISFIFLKVIIIDDKI